MEIWNNHWWPSVAFERKNAWQSKLVLRTWRSYSVSLVNMMSASKAAMAKDEKIRWQLHEWHLWGWGRKEDIWRVHSHRCVWLNFSQINKFSLPEGRERGLKIREACSIPLTLLSGEEISRLNKRLIILAGKLWKWLMATLRWGVLLLRKITFLLKS